MSLTPSSPRPDQIAELTRGLALPLDAVDAVFLQAIAEGLVTAFDAICRTSPATIASGNEAEVTALLVSRLNGMIGEEGGEWRNLVTSVARGVESLSFDGRHLEKRPDLSIHLSRRTARFPLIAEAKIIDQAQGEQLYCKNGIARFLDGEYAWGCREALMLAYVRDGTTILGRLTPYLAAAKNAATFGVRTAPRALSIGAADAATSEHDRVFVYAHTAAPQNKPGPIALWHLWLC